MCGIVRHEAKVHLFFHGGYQGRWSKQTKAIAAGIVVDLGMLVLQIRYCSSVYNYYRNSGWY